MNRGETTRVARFGSPLPPFVDQDWRGIDIFSDILILSSTAMRKLSPLRDSIHFCIRYIYSGPERELVVRQMLAIFFTSLQSQVVSM